MRKNLVILILIISAFALVVTMIIMSVRDAPAPLDTTLPPKLGHYVQTGGVKISFDVTAAGIENLSVSEVTGSFKSVPPTSVTCTLDVGSLTFDKNDAFSFTDNEGTTVSGTVHGSNANGKFMNHDAGEGCTSWSPDRQSYAYEQFEYLWQAEWVAPQATGTGQP